MSIATVASNEEKISLYFTGHGSDKEYHAQLLEKNPGYIVTFVWPAGFKLAEWNKNN